MTSLLECEVNIGDILIPVPVFENSPNAGNWTLVRNDQGALLSGPVGATRIRNAFLAYIDNDGIRVNFNGQPLTNQRHTFQFKRFANPVTNRSELMVPGAYQLSAEVDLNVDP